ncbi:MAG TPA: tRNA (adenosine(37)-N6)-threonylcarbamoyltransferase complex ATPase subunit type 1 TsaE, partial [Actinomycetota bacterium]|nr:tRNA (adenosine(37)-N6)-threonylcarbamoyltransferase complex ATPase subunit type 1 TsaE [Actinomycetota bacterium]
VQGAAAALGVRTRVTSPSFVLVREYDGDVRILHADVYRLNALQELFDLGYEEVFTPDAVTFVEWGDAVEGALPDDRLEVQLTRETGDERRVLLRAHGLSWAQRFGDLARELRSHEVAS